MKTWIVSGEGTAELITWWLAILRNCMMLSDSDNYTQLTRDNLVTELTQLCSPASLRHILPSLTLHPGMFVIISPIQLLHSHKSSHAPTPPQRRNMCVAGKWQNDVNINCFSLNLLVETHAACCVSISDQWGQVWRVTGESNCLETCSSVSWLVVAPIW